MIRFLRAVGFTDVEADRTLARSMFSAVTESPDSVRKTVLAGGEVFCEIKKKFFAGGGVGIAGRFDENQMFNTDYYFPYLESGIMSFDDIIDVPDIEENELPQGRGRDSRIGTDINFFMQNMLDYYSIFMKTGEKAYARVYLSGISRSGMIILGTGGRASRNSDVSERVTVKMFNEVSKRAETEDIYSIVDTMFRPDNDEDDCYTVIGTIINWSMFINSMTGDEVVNLLLECCDMVFPVVINKKDLYGVPAIGRRFKGYVWLQGRAVFDQMETS